MRLIDADALGIGKASREKFEEPKYADGWNSAIEIIENAPTIDPEELRPKGEWVLASDELCYWYVCSECGGRPAHQFRYDFFSPYCPHCGAKMRGVKDG